MIETKFKGWVYEIDAENKVLHGPEQIPFSKLPDSKRKEVERKIGENTPWDREPEKFSGVTNITCETPTMPKPRERESFALPAYDPHWACTIHSRGKEKTKRTVKLEIKDSVSSSHLNIKGPNPPKKWRHTLEYNLQKVDCFFDGLTLQCTRKY